MSITVSVVFSQLICLQRRLRS